MSQSVAPTSSEAGIVSGSASVVETMSKRDVAATMIALTMSIFVAMLSNTVVLTALPKIVGALHGTQADYSWIVTASLLTITVCVPIWGRMSDLLNKKLLIQLCVGGYMIGSLLASLAPATWVIIAARVVIGVAGSGIIALMQTISVQITAPRDRARWVGYRGAAVAVATLGAPTLGGFIADHFGWRMCFLVGLPFALAAVVMLQRSLKLPRVDQAGSVKIDWPGTILLALGVVGVMVWGSIVAPACGWLTPTSLWLLVAAFSLVGASIFFEVRSPWPLLPLHLFKNRDVVLCVLASAGSGVTLFCSAVFLAIYLQLGRGMSASTAGVMALPEATSTLIAALLAGHLISRTGAYRPALILGATGVLFGFILLSTLGDHTPLLQVGLYVALVGGGLGVISENLVLVVQNAVGRNAPGSASALVVFSRTLAAVLCVALMGSVLSERAALEIHAGGVTQLIKGHVPVLAAMTPAMRTVVEHAYAHGVASVYLACTPAALIILISVSLLQKGTLHRETDMSPSAHPTGSPTIVLDRAVGR